MNAHLLLLARANVAPVQWPDPKSSLVPASDGYVAIPNVALPPADENRYRAIFDATHAADKPAQLVPALNMAGSELNAFVAHVPMEKAKLSSFTAWPWSESSNGNVRNLFRSNE